MLMPTAGFTPELIIVEILKSSLSVLVPPPLSVIYGGSKMIASS
jgi:hypothetical protein